MPGNLDFGQDEDAPTPATNPVSAFRYFANGSEQKVHLVSGETVSCGRHSGQDICLRVQPTSVEENARKTGMISSEHCRFNLGSDGITVEDLETTNGTKLAGKQLVPLNPGKLANDDRVDVADVLELALKLFPSSTESAGIECCLISRINNDSSSCYLWLIDRAKLGTEANSVIQIACKNTRPHRGLDFGEPNEAQCEVYLCWNQGNLVVECCSENVKFNGAPLKLSETRVLAANDELRLLDTVLTFE